MVDDEIRERVIEAADRLFYGRGITAVGMDELRTAAGVSLRRLYQQFPSKDDIVIAVLDRRHEVWTGGVAAQVSRFTDARLRLLAIYDYLAAWFRDDDFRGCGFINAFGELGVVSPRVAAVTREHKASFQAYVDRLVAEAGADAALGPQLSILAEGAQTTAAISGTPEAADQARGAAEVLIAAAMHPVAA